MRQNLFLGWNILLAMLFTFYSCSNEMDSDFESDEEAVNLLRTRMELDHFLLVYYIFILIRSLGTKMRIILYIIHILIGERALIGKMLEMR